MTFLCPVTEMLKPLKAASSGAALSVKVVTNIAANLIAFSGCAGFHQCCPLLAGNMVDIQGLNFRYSPLDLWAGLGQW